MADGPAPRSARSPPATPSMSLSRRS